MPDKVEAPLCAYRPNPTRADELRDEISFVIRKEREEYPLRIKPNADYLAAVQKGTIQPFMRRMVFEWNLEVTPPPHPLPSPPTSLRTSFLPDRTARSLPNRL